MTLLKNHRHSFVMRENIAVFTAHAELQSAATALAEKLHLPFSNQADYLLLLTPDYLGLKKTDDKSLPLHVSFTSGKMDYRRQQVGLRREALARALGLKKETRPKIIDATAGLARDSFILASLGFEVTLLERSPIVYELVNDGIKRALLDEKIAPIVKRMHLIQTDAVTWLKNTNEKLNIIYLDPMFPERKKSALTKMNMRIFHDVVGDDPDADELFHAALASTAERIVVKRPRLADELGKIKPAFSLEGSSSRFDVYLATNKNNSK